MRIIDIGANLLDDMFRGIYHGRQCHPPDLTSVLDRATRNSIEGIIVTAGTVSEAHSALELTTHHDELPLFATAGIHPTNASETLMTTSNYQEELLAISNSSDRVVAIGECGLDYARTQYSSREDQIKVFRDHFPLAKATGKPMFLHLRNAFSDFYSLVRDFRDHFDMAVVHSFDGSVEEASRLLALGLHIGINGCSLKTDNGLQVVRSVPLERLLVESDAPWCELRPTHASHRHSRLEVLKKDKDRWSSECWVKGRNEPSACLAVCQVIAEVKNIDITTVTEAVYANTIKVFPGIKAYLL